VLCSPTCHSCPCLHPPLHTTTTPTWRHRPCRRATEESFVGLQSFTDRVVVPPAAFEHFAAGRDLATRGAQATTAAATAAFAHFADVAARASQGAEEVFAETVAQARRAREENARTA
jgi:hypothetical protein